MPFTIERNDLAFMDVDVVVVAANEGLRIDGGVGLAVAERAGLAQMQAACDEIGGCPTGSAVLTPGFALAARHVVHAVGPVWHGGSRGEEELLRSAYDSALARAAEVGAKSLAFPLVSAHTFGVPVRISFVIAVEAAKRFLEEHECDVHLVLYGEDATAVGQSLYGDIAQYIDDRYVALHAPSEGNAQWVRDSYAMPMQAPPMPSSQRAEPLPGGARRRRGLGSFLQQAVEGALEWADRRRGERDDADEDEGWVPDEEASVAFDSLEEASASYSEPYEPTAAYSEAAAPSAAYPDAALPGASYSEIDAFTEDYSAMPAPSASYSGMGPAAAARPGTDAPAMEYSKARESAEATIGMPAVGGAKPSGGLAEWLDKLDAPFSTTLLALIDERGMTDVQVYKRANMSRQLFSKIRSDAAYRPTKKTVLALSVALGLDIDETADLLGRAGFALSRSSKSDIIVEYFIVNGNYDIFAINEALYAFDQPLL